ncbi:kinase-like protein [Roridomyces roridus]|uniref:non-specific serine/threonine protein kinase n=1 Tax=Roridomyces roridus TaxID=1738132 RepID=A0AAD7FWZ7_9AGAR|nr:kinase-like protein [Roridomyces roridus]
MQPSLADLSRNASVISTSSTDSDQELTLPRPRPIRTFSAPRSRSPQSPTTRGASRPPPSYLSRELGYAEPEPTPPSKPKSTSIPGRASLQDFQFGSTLGEGSYSTVKLATSRVDGKQYAVKVITKSHLIRAQKTETAAAERQALIRLRGHPGIVSLYHAFQDDWSLYFVIDLATNGEMQSLLSRLGSLSTRCAQYYTAQIASAVEYMHSKDVLHRDLKPENLLLDDAFRIKITDFGTGKVLERGEQRATTFVGTAQYQAPELLELKETTKSSDYWAFGCVVYQMIAGRFAFNDKSDYLTWQKVKKVEYDFPSGFDAQAQDLVQKLLVHDPLARLGAGPKGSPNDPSALKLHPFLSSIVWSSLWTDPAPPIEPGLVKKEHSSAQGHWEDIGAAWDKLVGNDDNDSDEIEWASDADGPRHLYGNPVRYDPPDAAPEFPSVEDSRGDTSSSSSHESASGAAVDRLGDSLERMSIRTGRASPDGPARRSSLRLEAERGRDRAPTPLHNDFAAVLKLADDEKIIFDSPVEARTPRRRASRILLPPIKSKRRHLVLTSRRLFCLKLNLSVKSELALRPSGKDSRNVVSSVELRGEQEFIVLTGSKTFIYGVKYPFSPNAWRDKITRALEGQ